jgi:hypothetical protein
MGQSCALYTLEKCSSSDISEPSTENTPSSSSEVALIAILVILLVALLGAGFAILTLGLMVRDMRNERVQDGLPNPYSCVFSLVGRLCPPGGEDDEEKPTKKPVSHDKKEKVKSTEATKHYHRKEPVILHNLFLHVIQSSPSHST